MMQCFVNLNNFLVLIFILGLQGCQFSNDVRPIQSLNALLLQSSNSYREPILGSRWLVSLVKHKGKEKIELIDLRSRRTVFLPGINRSDSQPISVTISANGDKLAFIRQRAGQTELLIYRRKLATIQRIELSPKGIPRRVSLDGTGKLLAVQVSRDGRWNVEVIRL